MTEIEKNIQLAKKTWNNRSHSARSERARSSETALQAKSAPTENRRMERRIYDRLVRSQIVRDYEAFFTDATGLALKLIPKDIGSDFSFGPRANSFCALLTRNPAASKICWQFHAEARKCAAENPEKQRVCCFAAMAHVFVPIVVARQHVATLFGGQVLLERPTKRTFSRLSSQLLKLGVEAHLSPLENAYFQSPVISEKQFQAILGLLQIFAGHLSQYASGCLLEQADDEPLAVRQAKKFAQTRATERITMQDAAHHVHLSSCYFCKMFKRTASMTFTEYLSRVRIEKAKSVLGNASARVTEAASEAGFESIPHFNRVFRKYTGVSPTQYRASLRK
jgi:AraC-like DNA-binding protein/ligand-binding sensor protein